MKGSGNEALVFRLLKDEEKEAGLAAAVRALRSGSDAQATHRVDQQTFRMIPGAPFAYWVSDDVRKLFATLPSLEDVGARARVTNPAGDDTRFFRLSWEIPAASLGTIERTWVPLAKGGAYSPYYADIHLVVDWDPSLRSYRGFLGTPHRPLVRPANLELFLCPGLTWPRRTQGGLSLRVLPAGCIFADKGPAVFAEEGMLPFLLGLLNSTSGRCMVDLQMAFGSYEVGVLQRVPIPEAEVSVSQRVGTLARSIHDLKRSLDTTTENSHAFVLPALLQRSAPTLAARLGEWNAWVEDAAAKIVAAQREIDETCYRLYGISAQDRTTIEAELGTEIRGLPERMPRAQAAIDLVSWMVGVVLGRFDVRLASGDRATPELTDPFAKLPATSPGMLPGSPPPPSYPIPIDDDGILVDDEPHADDVVRRVRDVFRLLWGDQADEFEKETCVLLGTKGLRDYFGKTGKGGFWDEHFRRYFKSRRRAPIYWPLQSPRGLYRVWIYAHRLTKDTLPKLLGPRYLGGATAGVKHAIAELRPAGQTKADLTKKQEGRLADLDALLVDLEEFTALLRAALARTNDQGDTVGYVPDLNDGVVLAAAPLHEVIPWLKTRKHRGKTVSELEAYWEGLEEGEYDWSHLAMLYWPTRVTEKCRKDKSFALAHGLDAEFFPGLREELRRQAEASPAADDADEEAEPTDDEQYEE